jgi:3-dehydroquinate dehydratase/shikimate dehydrogenase
MTHLCVAIFVTDLDKARRDVALAAEAGADFVELRIDQATHADGFDEAALLNFIANVGMPSIVTCRPTWEGGQSELADRDRLMLLTRIAEAGGSYVDLEQESYQRRASTAGDDSDQAIDSLLSKPRDSRPGIIFSSHDFSGRPARLTSIVQSLFESPADVAKIVWTARTIRDNLEAFEILRHRAKPTIALCMGEHGLISRILAKKFGAFLTFASLSNDSGTAPGQVTIADMKRLYRWDSITPRTKVYGVVASPVMHSMSPAIHNAAFDATSHDGVYLPLLVNPGYESFKAFMETFLDFEPLHLSGFSITLPHKENALRYLTEKGADIEPLARDIGAVNTIIIDRSDGLKLRAINTDYAAILDSITAKLAITREALANYRVAVIGAGGTGRTAVAALARYGATVVVYNRTKERAEELAAEFNNKTGKVVAARLEKLCDSCCHIFIHCTSVGMYPNVDANPLGDSPPAFGPDTVVFDTIYNPIKTKLLQHAEAAGAKTIGGIEMFVRQAARQFETWTNQNAPVDVMRKIIETRLAIA